MPLIVAVLIVLSQSPPPPPRVETVGQAFARLIRTLPDSAPGYEASFILAPPFRLDDEGPTD